MAGDRAEEGGVAVVRLDELAEYLPDAFPAFGFRQLKGRLAIGVDDIGRGASFQQEANDRWIADRGCSHQGGEPVVDRPVHVGASLDQRPHYLAPAFKDRRL